MKILFVSSARKGKGISPFIFSQGESIKKLGNEIEYYILEGSGVLNYLKSVLVIKKKIGLAKYDLIHAHYGYAGIVAKLAGPKCKVVCSFLGDDLEGSVNKNYKYSKFSKILVKLNVLFAKYFFDFNIVKSESLKSKLSNQKNCQIVPNGVSLEIFNEISYEEAIKKLNLSVAYRYILFAGNPNRTVKNVRLFNESQNFWNKDWKPLYLENVAPNDVVYYYNAADVVILTSFHEGSPNVIKEAMACSRPIVSTNVGDVAWIIGNTEGCYLCSFNPEELARKITYAVSYAEKYYRTKGRQRIIELGLDSETIATKIIDIYKKVLSN